MPRPKDCVYCGKPTGSSEHVFPAALGGRRENKGILCDGCNQGELSRLIKVLAAQLRDLRGLLGVRPDHRDEPVPAAVPHGDKTVLIDGLGRPSYRDPETLSDQPLENGKRLVQTAFRDEAQMEAWRAEQRRLGHTITDHGVRRVARYMTEPLQVEWRFGGDETFRAAASIAVNFLAHKFPLEARAPGLRPLKDYIRGTRTISPGEERPVWHHLDQVAVPTSTIEIGHQVFIRLDQEHGSGYAIVRFFDAVEIVVDFGALAPAATTAVLFNIDPHQDHPPADLFEVACDAADFPAEVTTLKVGDELGATMTDEKQLARMLRAVGERQSRLRIEPLVEQLGRIRETPPNGRVRAVLEALDDHSGSIYRLIEAAVERFNDAFATSLDMQADGLVEYMASFAEPDPDDLSGITLTARVALRRVQLELARVLAESLEAGPITHAQVQALLEEGPGLVIAARILLEPIMEEYESEPDAAAHEAP